MTKIQKPNKSQIKIANNQIELRELPAFVIEAG